MLLRAETFIGGRDGVVFLHGNRLTWSRSSGISDTGVSL